MRLVTLIWRLCDKKRLLLWQRGSMGAGCTLKIMSIGSQLFLLSRLTLLVLETAFWQAFQLVYTRASQLNKQSWWAITLGALLWVKLVSHISQKPNCRSLLLHPACLWSLRSSNLLEDTLHWGNGRIWLLYSIFTCISTRGWLGDAFLCGLMQNLKECHEGFQVEEVPFQTHAADAGQSQGILCSSQ